MRYILQIILFFLITTACTENTSKKDKLIVGMELAYPPFEMKDAQGKPSGISVDLANALGQYIGKEVIIENIAWAGLIPSLQTGKIDIIISSLTITDKRKEQLNFSLPYFKAKLAVLANINSPIQTQKDLNNPSITIAIKQGTTGFLYAHKRFSKAKINSFTSENAVLTEVLQGKADALIFDQLTIYKNFKKNPTKTKIIPLALDEEDVDYWGIAVNKKNPELLEKINEFLIHFQEKDGFNDLTKKHLTIDKEEFEKYGLDFFF